MLTRTPFTRALAGAGLAALLLSGIPVAAQAAPATGLTIDPVTYTASAGVVDRSSGTAADDLLADSGSTSFPAKSPRSGRAIIGPDGRGQVTKPNVDPYRKTGQLTMGNYICTAWLVSASTAVTAGHCVLDDAGEPIADRIRFSAARNVSENPYGVQDVTAITVDDRFPAVGADWAVVQLSEPVGDRAGWFGAEATTDLDLGSRAATVTGYPGDKPLGTMWTHTDDVTRVSDRSIYYVTDTMGGQSGSALTTDSEDVAHGIHIGAVTGANVATRITGEIYNVIENSRR